MPVRVTGLSAFIRATDAAGKEAKKLARADLREAAEPVREEWERRLLDLTPAPTITARALGISVRKTGSIAVEERKGRTTGTRPDWGRRVKALGEEALTEKQSEVEGRMEKAVDKIADRMEGR